jgi:hypothetical protein
MQAPHQTAIAIGEAGELFSRGQGSCWCLGHGDMQDQHSPKRHSATTLHVRHPSPYCTPTAPLAQIAGGALADRIGPKLVILWASALGGLCTMASASAQSVDALWLAQVLLGVSQGPLFPTSIAFLAPWLPPSERSLASTMLDLGITLVRCPRIGREEGEEYVYPAAQCQRSPAPSA